MSKLKNLITTSAGFAGLGIVVLLYNFFNMYSLAAKCPVDVSIQPCQAYNNWQLLNRIGLILLVTGIVILVIGLIKRQRKN